MSKVDDSSKAITQFVDNITNVIVFMRFATLKLKFNISEFDTFIPMYIECNAKLYNIFINVISIFLGNQPAGLQTNAGSAVEPNAHYHEIITYLLISTIAFANSLF